MAQLHEACASLSAPASPWFMDELCNSLHDLSLQQAISSINPPLGSPLLAGMPASPPVDYCGVNAAALAGTGLLDPAFQQLAALQALNQQQLAGPVTADSLLPLLNLSNLLAAQRLGNVGVEAAELLALKEELWRGSPTGSVAARGTGPLHNPLYKTELCRSWEEIGSCRYGAKCQFAHGREELRPVQRHPKYKTEVCRTFAQTGTCPYGTRCRFIHHDATLASLRAPPSRGSSASSLSALLPEQPRSPTMAGLAIPGSPLSYSMQPMTPSPSMAFAPGGASSPSTPHAAATNSTAAAAAALASLLSAAGAGNGSTLANMPTGGAMAGLGLGAPAPCIPQGLPPIGVQMAPPLGMACAAATPGTPSPVTAAAPPIPPSSSLASAPATPTATHSGSKVVWRSVSEGPDALNRRLPIFARLAEKEEEGGEQASDGSSTTSSAH